MTTDPNLKPEPSIGAAPLSEQDRFQRYMAVGEGDAYIISWGLRTWNRVFRVRILPEGQE
jgi:hypothetical protein